MFPVSTRRFAGLLVLGLVLTSLPARVWLFGACPVCGNIHPPVLVVCLGENPDDPTPGDDPSDDPPASPHDDACVPPLPHCPTAAPTPTDALAAVGELRTESDPVAAALPTASPIRPPRA